MREAAIYPFERFSERAKKVLTLAQEEAERSHYSYIGTEHLLLGLLREGDGLTYEVGDRVLVHDPDPPYRLWEGRVAKADEPHFDVSIPGRSAGEFVTVELELIHKVPMTLTRDCRFCSVR